MKHRCSRTAIPVVHGSMEIEADDVLARLAGYSDDDDDGDVDSDDGGGLAALQDRYDSVKKCDARHDNVAMARRVLACIRKREHRHARSEVIAGAGSDDATTLSFLLYPAVIISSVKFYDCPPTFATFADSSFWFFAI